MNSADKNRLIITTDAGTLNVTEQSHYREGKGFRYSYPVSLAVNGKSVPTGEHLISFRDESGDTWYPVHDVFRGTPSLPALEGLSLYLTERGNNEPRTAYTVAGVELEQVPVTTDEEFRELVGA